MQGGASAQTIQGNYIGTNAAGSAAIPVTTGSDPQKGLGVTLYEAMTLGGSNIGEGNLIAGNSGDAQVATHDADTIAGNVIGLNAAGTANLDSGFGPSGTTVGVHVVSGAAVVGTGGGGHNVIAGAGNEVIVEAPGAGTTIQNNYVGTNATGSAAVGGFQAVIVFANNVLVGGPTSAERNVIAGSQNSGVVVSGADGASLYNNYIGTDKTGTAALGNHSGVVIDGSTNAHIGAGPAEGNLISGNGTGVLVADGSTVVVDNKIGTNASGGDSGIGNGNGIDVRDTSSVTVDQSYTNTIAYNSNTGVAIKTSNGRGVTIRLNSIHDNGGLGIDIGDDGITPNDAGYGHQNFPVITSADDSGTVKFSLDTDRGHVPDRRLPLDLV